MMLTPKQWWTPVWKGLVVDEEGKHYRRMRNAVWLFLYLLLYADRRRGFLVRKIRTIGADTGVSERTIRTWLRVLRRERYIETFATGRCLRIQIAKWKGLMYGPKKVDQLGSPLPGRAAETCHHADRQQGRIPLQLGCNPSPSDSPKEITLNRYLLNNNTDGNTFKERRSRFLHTLTPSSREELLALDLATALADRKGLARYLSYANRFPESLLRQALGEVKEIANEQVTKSPATLFHNQIKTYAQQTAHRSRN